MKKLHGNFSGLKAGQIAGLETLYDMRVSPQYLRFP